MQSHLYLLLGSNLGDSLTHLKTACEAISRSIGSIITTSSIYKTKAWGKLNQPDFYNQVILVSTGETPQNVLKNLLSIEKEMGRNRIEKWGARIIDLDILFFNDLVVDSPNLQIPHPGIPNRRFTLVPLTEIAPEFVHPVYKKTITELLRDCDDPLAVEKL